MLGSVGMARCMFVLQGFPLPEPVLPEAGSLSREGGLADVAVCIFIIFPFLWLQQSLVNQEGMQGDIANGLSALRQTFDEQRTRVYLYGFSLWQKLQRWRLIIMYLYIATFYKKCVFLVFV